MLLASMHKLYAIVTVNCYICIFNIVISNVSANKVKLKYFVGFLGKDEWRPAQYAQCLPLQNWRIFAQVRDLLLSVHAESVFFFLFCFQNLKTRYFFFFFYSEKLSYSHLVITSRLFLSRRNARRFFSWENPVNRTITWLLEGI